jgi:hypothetical protein
MTGTAVTVLPSASVPVIVPATVAMTPRHAG